MTSPPSGEQWEIHHGDQRATVVEVGGGLRCYDVAGRDVLHPYDLEAMCDGAHGTPLIPWPNRLADGRYTWDGTSHQLPLTEPEKHNAIHGLLRWHAWRLLGRSAGEVSVGITLHPIKGYPFALDVAVDYALADDGLTTTMTATNVGREACPYAVGQHPYLSPGAGLVDACTVRLAAARRILTDPDRQLPIGIEDVAGTPYDLREGRVLGELEIDHAYTELARDADGRAWLSLDGVDGWSAQLWVDEAFPIVEVYTADTLSRDRRRRGLGAEPMSAPPNALQTGELVRRLEPGESTVARWGARLVRLDADVD